MAAWGQADSERAERRLRGLVAAGMSVEAAVRVTHGEDGVGALLICPAVEAVTGLGNGEAKRLVAGTLLTDAPS